MKARPAPIAFLAAFLVLPLAASAEGAWLSANDLKAGSLTAPLAVDGFTINATAEKAVVVEAIDVARTAEDGEVFNARIKLGGTGNLEYRSIRFTGAEKATLKVYLASSSKTDARTLKLVDAAGAAVAELVAPPDDGLKAGMASFALPAAGDYCLFSANSGINVYQILVE